MPTAASIPHVAPSVLDPLDFYLRGQVEADVVARYNNYDIYNCELLDLEKSLELDHTVEKQCFTFVLSSMGLRKGEGDFELVTGVLREKIVNEVDNLALTRTTTTASRVLGSGTTWTTRARVISAHTRR
ncbi:hypothetical protein PHYPSEUDO_015161 [Phytophthora pseudosyringae]|uniref:Uncharacterized protein n=1 Tax=Phytophthora pseudosyringae TaxID=221518 RepID=A0A8T1W0G7_9STRA|nr:hypothetical protein PHYPSEUDO_015161 [Phytophthora pseudosyringae]